MSETYIIVGAGHAAGQAAMTLRSEGFKGRLIMIGDEPYVPYQRPPLSKKFLAQEIGIERVYFTLPEFYEKEGIEVRLNTRVTGIDRETRTITQDNGEELEYDKLLLCTGASVRRLNVPGTELKGIYYLRNIEDVQAIQSHFREGNRLVIVGGGYIGLEVAAVAVKRGIDVTVLEMESMVMARVVAPLVSEFYEKVHMEEGVKIRTGVTVTGFTGEDGKVTKVVCNDGSEVDADFVVIGVGIVPNVELAQDCGLKVENGVVVDEYCRTEDPNILAAGDCTNHPNALLGRRLRLESVHNAVEQGKTAARTMCGKLQPYNQVPWFWSDQYNLKLQIAGLSQGYDEVVIRGAPEKRSFAAFYLKDGQLIAVDAVNRAPEYMVAQRLIAAKAKIPPEKLADENLKMKELGQEYLAETA